MVEAANARILQHELTARRQFFETVEKSPLTHEQASAVVTFDNRVRVMAAAGSGKTSVMVARAAYAIERGLVSPDRILMLAFNSEAASELRGRVEGRLQALDLAAGDLQARTFHSFGRSLIGEATGRKPSIAPWVESGRDIDKIVEIVDSLRDTSDQFRFQWDIYRLLYGRVVGDGRLADAPEGGEPDGYDSTTGRAGYETFAGEVVRSQGERLIADWLFFNTVDYRYEKPYVHDTADESHAQYRPDFYYPSANVWHEHWALRADGTAPEEFKGYAESMAWKKDLHARFGTTLIETRWHEIINLSGFRALARDLRRHGIELNWNPDRPTRERGPRPIDHERMARLIKTFMSHVKANSLTRDDTFARMVEGDQRTELFLEVYWQVHERWEQQLRESQYIDFDDMLLRAADILESRPSLARYDLVLVDEFQDTSQVRARLVQALLQGGKKYFMAVGDDWQAINRFAGADLAVMVEFEKFFGPAVTCRLTTTFRCPQVIADVAGRFVSRNPVQIAKEVRSARPERGTVSLVRLDRHDDIVWAIEQHLRDLGARTPGVTVDVLGRYRRDRQFVPRRPVPGVRLTFRTIHGAKGLEADHIVLPNMAPGSHGFPSQISDDPVLDLVMAAGDGYPHAEERRLLYVALTRARLGVSIFTHTGVESPFAVELLRDPDVDVRATSVDGQLELLRVCPECGRGTLVARRGRYGEFFGCSRFPACRATVRAERVEEGVMPSF
jgi:DNA helicase-4